MGKLRVRRSNHEVKYCKIHKDVINNKMCREKWWNSCCKDVPEIQISRAYCQTVNFKEGQENIPLNKDLYYNHPEKIQYERMMNGLNKKENNYLKKPINNKPKTEGKIMINDKAAEILSSAKNEKEVIKLMKQNKDKFDISKLKKIEIAVKNGETNFGRAKMTCLNILRNGMKNDKQTIKSLPTPKSKKKIITKQETQTPTITSGRKRIRREPA